MKKLGVALLALLFGCGIAHAQTGTPKPKSSLSVEIGNCFPDNVVGLITPALVRGCMQDFLASWQQYSGVNLQTGTSYTVQNSDYGQMIITTNASPVAIALPAPSVIAGFYPFSFYVNVQGLGAVTLTPPVGVTIAQAASITLSTNQAVFVVADGTNWQVVFSTNAPSTEILGGAANSLAYYQTTGTTLGPLGFCNSGIYETNASGVPSCSTFLPSGISASGTFTGPDGGTWTSFGFNGSAIGVSTPENGNFNNLSFTQLSPTSLASSPVTITGLTINNSPSASNDYLLYFNAASNSIERCTVGACGSSGVAGVSSLNGLTGGLSIVNNGGVNVSATGTTVNLNVAITPPQGRLTLQSGVPVMNTSQINATSIFYTCFHGGNTVPVYNGTTDVLLTIPGCNISTAMQSSGTGVLTGSNVFDVWGVVSSGALAICVATDGTGGGWASDTGGSNTARGTGYSQLDFTTRPYITNANALATCYKGTSNLGSVAANRATYLGTIYTSSAGQVTWQFAGVSLPNTAILGIWNAYNRVPTTSQTFLTSGSWTFTSTSYLTWGNASYPNGIVLIVRGLNEDSPLVNASLDMEAIGSAACTVGIGLDSTSSASGQQGGINTQLAIILYSPAFYSGFPGVGVHRFYGLQAVVGECSFGSGGFLLNTPM